MKQYIYLAITGILLNCLSACTAINSDDTTGTDNERVQISTLLSTFSGLQGPEDNKRDDLTAYFFVDNIFTEKRVVTDDALSASIDKKKDQKIYFVANPALFKELATLQAGSSDVSVLLSVKTETSTPDVGAKMFMASQLDLKSAVKKQTVDLIRGVARLDITMADPDISISAVRVKNTATEAPLFADSKSKPATTSYAKTLTTPATAAIPGVFYLYEHTNVTNCTVEVDIVLKGQPMTTRAILPATIARNMVYEVAVKGTQSNSVTAELKIKEWGVGSVVDAIPDSGAPILLDPTTTQLPGTVVADYKSSTITIPGVGSSFIFGLKSDFTIEVTPEGSAASSVHITPIAGDKNRFQVTVDPQPWNADAYSVRYALKNTLLENVYDYLTFQIQDRPYDIPTITLGGVEWMAFNTLGKDGLIQTRVSAGQSIEEVYQTRFADAMGYYFHWGRPHTFKPWDSTEPNTAGTANPWNTEESVPCPPRFRVASLNDYKKVFPSGATIPSTYTVNGKEFKASVITPATQAILPNLSKVTGCYLIIEEVSTGRKLLFPFSGHKGDKAAGSGWAMGAEIWSWAVEFKGSGYANVFQVLGGSTTKAAYITLAADGFATVRCVKK